tara:strand:- start:2024 stop:3172 length:1149 start_codon:yes stop_codon:yes gene_type:complete
MSDTQGGGQTSYEESSGEVGTELPRLLLHGLDSLYVSYAFDFAFSKLDFPDLEFRKELIKSGQSAYELTVLGSEDFLLRPYGSKPYRYVLVNDAFTLAITEIMQPTARVQFSSEALWNQGALALHNRICAWAHSVGARMVRPEKVIRADWAFDFDLSQVDFAEDHFATRARKNAKWREGSKVQTFTLGTNETVIRVYDKIAEIEQQSGKAWFFDLWGQNKDVWRIEFQVRGERLKAGAIRTLDDLASLQADLLRELSENHTTLRAPNGDGNKARWPLHPLWRSLQAGIAAMPQLGHVRSIDPKGELEYRLLTSSRMIYGYLKGLAALNILETAVYEGKPPVADLAFLDFMDLLPELLFKHHTSEDWSKGVGKRVQDFEFGQW